MARLVSGYCGAGRQPGWTGRIWIQSIQSWKELRAAANPLSYATTETGGQKGLLPFPVPGSPIRVRMACGDTRSWFWYD